MSQIEVDRLRTGSQVKFRLAVGKRRLKVLILAASMPIYRSRGFACSHGRKRNDRGRGERRSAVLWRVFSSLSRLQSESSGRLSSSHAQT